MSGKPGNERRSSHRTAMGRPLAKNGGTLGAENRMNAHRQCATCASQTVQRDAQHSPVIQSRAALPLSGFHLVGSPPTSPKPSERCRDPQLPKKAFRIDLGTERKTGPEACMFPRALARMPQQAAKAINRTPPLRAVASITNLSQAAKPTRFNQPHRSHPTGADFVSICIEVWPRFRHGQLSLTERQEL